MDLASLGVSGARAAAGALTEKAENYVNQPDVELHWAMKAYSHAETYFNLICSVDPSCLKLTRQDDVIYTKFKLEFPDFKIDVLDEESLKSPAAKEKWRPFSESFKGHLEDYNYGTLIRIDNTKDYSDANTMLVLRVQFLAIEIARNREGFNKGLSEKYGKKKEQETKDGEAKEH